MPIAHPAPPRPRRYLALLIALALLASGCSEASSDGGSGDLDSPEGIEAMPLDESTRITVAVPAPLELFSQPYLAQAFGEFEKENLEVEIVTMLPADAVTQIASGGIDVCVCAFNPGVFNAIESGVDVRAVAGTFSGLQEGVGVYVRPELADGQPESLQGKKIAISSGFASAVVTDLVRWLEPAGMDLDDLEPVNIPATDTLTALQNGGADAAYLLAPFSDMAAKDGTGDFVSETQPTSLSTAFFFGRRLLDEEPDVGAAFIRAIVRTTRDHLQGDYHGDKELMSTMAEALGADEASLTATDEVTFDPDLTTASWPDQITQVQEIWAGMDDVLAYDEPLEVDDVLDTGILTHVVGD